MAVNVYVGARPSGEVETIKGGPHSRKISRLFGARKKIFQVVHGARYTNKNV